jgi:hypothetical protein
MVSKQTIFIVNCKLRTDSLYKRIVDTGKALRLINAFYKPL